MAAVMCPVCFSIIKENSSCLRCAQLKKEMSNILRQLNAACTTVLGIAAGAALFMLAGSVFVG
jgi:hypothetical protein